MDWCSLEVAESSSFDYRREELLVNEDLIELSPVREVQKELDVLRMIGAGIVVTIDGPAASGKSSVSREFARRMEWSWVSTGAFYRGLAYVAFQRKVDLKNETELEKLAHSSIWSVQMGTEQTSVLLDGFDVTDEINREEIGSLASVISSFPSVRKALLDAQRQCAIGVCGLVAEGRDCGTVVFPKADVKFFLTARAEDRAARRALEEGRDLTKTIDEQKLRDAQDANRKAAPMLASSDSHTIDTTAHSLVEVVNIVEGFVKTHFQFGTQPVN